MWNKQLRTWFSWERIRFAFGTLSLRKKEIFLTDPFMYVTVVIGGSNIIRGLSNQFWRETLTTRAPLQFEAMVEPWRQSNKALGGNWCSEGIRIQSVHVDFILNLTETVPWCPGSGDVCQRDSVWSCSAQHPNEDRTRTVDQEIFAVKIIRVLNFRVKNISPPNGSAM